MFLWPAIWCCSKSSLQRSGQVTASNNCPTASRGSLLRRVVSVAGWR